MGIGESSRADGATQRDDEELVARAASEVNGRRYLWPDERDGTYGASDTVAPPPSPLLGKPGSLA